MGMQVSFARHVERECDREWVNSQSGKKNRVKMPRRMVKTPSVKMSLEK